MPDPARDGEDIQRICPPHFYVAGWASDNEGVIFCRLCGDRLPLSIQKVGAPELERMTAQEEE